MPAWLFVILAVIAAPEVTVGLVFFLALCITTAICNAIDSANSGGAMRVWVGVGSRKNSVSIIIQPFRWRWSLFPEVPALFREFYIGPVTLQWWSK